MCEEQKNKSHHKGSEDVSYTSICMSDCKIRIAHISDMDAVAYVFDDDKLVKANSPLEDQVINLFKFGKAEFMKQLSTEEGSCSDDRCECVAYEERGRMTKKKQRKHRFRLLTKGFDADVDVWVKVTYNICWEVFEGICVEKEESI